MTTPPPTHPSPTGIDPRHDISVTEAFTRQVAAHPEAVAIETSDGRVTYAQLAATAAGITAIVREHLGGAAEPVAVAAVDPIKAAAAVLGILGAGATAMPMGLDGPSERIAAMVTRSTSRFILVDRDQQEKAATLGLAWEIIRIEEAGDRSAGEAVEIDPNAPALLLYTSGSTGEPKGIIRLHRQMVASNWKPQWHDIKPGDRVGHTMEPTFAAAFAYLFGALLNGATLCPYPMMTQGIHGLGPWIERMEITVLGIGPSMFRRVIDGLPTGAHFRSLREVNFGTEPLLRSDVDHFRKIFPPSCRLRNVMGGSETDVVSSYQIDTATTIEDAVVPVGSPPPWVEVIIIDDAGQVITGEGTGLLCVASPLLSPGYWRQPDLTAAAFVPHPSDPSRVMFRTGDKVTRGADGLLRFLGRVDHRAKVAGVAVDLTEVERALLALPIVKEAAVLVPTSEDGADERLIAYIVPAPGVGSIDPIAMRRLLALCLPAGSIPQEYLVLERMPLTPRGKVDRTALADLTGTVQRPDREIEAPATDMERSLAAIWTQVLGDRAIGVNDHFFDDLGGSSIQGLQVIALIARRLDRDLAPRVLLASPTIAALATAIETQAGQPRGESLIPIRTSGSLTPFICIHGGAGGAFFVRDIAQALHPDRPVYGMQAEGFDGIPGPYRPIEEIAARYLAEIRDRFSDLPVIIGGLSSGGLVAWEIGRQMETLGESPPLIVMLDTHRPSAADLKDLTDPSRHLRRIRAGWRTGIAYLVGGTYRRVVSLIRRVRIAIALRFGRRLPDGLRDFHFWSLTKRAHYQHDPAAYGGAVLAIASQGLTDTRVEQWEPLTRSGLIVKEVAATHHDLVRPPYVGEVGAILEQEFARVDAARR